MEKGTKLSEITQYALELINENCKTINIGGEIYHVYDNTTVTNGLHDKFGHRKSANSLSSYKSHGTMAFQKQPGVNNLLFVDTSINDFELEADNEATRILNRINAECAKRDGLVRDIKPRGVFLGNFKGEESEEDTIITRKRGYRVPLHTYITPEERDRKLAATMEIKPSKSRIIDGDKIDLKRVTKKRDRNLIDSTGIEIDMEWKPEEDLIILEGIENKTSPMRVLEKINLWNENNSTGLLRGLKETNSHREYIIKYPKPNNRVNYSKTINQSVEEVKSRMNTTSIKEGTVIVWAKQMLKPIVSMCKSFGIELKWTLKTSN